MLPLTTVTLIVNGLMLTLAIGSLFIILWQDSRRDSNIYFSIFMLAMVLWASGSLLGRATAQISIDENLTLVGLRLLEVGFAGACLSIYALSATLTQTRSTLFWATVLAGIIILIGYQIFLAALDVSFQYDIDEQGLLTFTFPRVNHLLYLVFSIGTFFIVWQNLSKIKQPTLSFGLLLFSFGQIASLLSPRLRALAIAEDTSTLAALSISYAFVRSQVMAPLLGRSKQLEVVRDVGLAITSRVHSEEVLDTIAAQAANLLQGDGSAIYLKRDQYLVLETVHNIPRKFIGTTLKLSEGVAGKVATQREGLLINDYRHSWSGTPDMPLAFETFGALVCVPLIFRDDIVGVLLVVEGRDGRLFDQEDMHLLQLLGPQAAVAITNSRLFDRQRALTDELTIAKTQLETVLISTENPVIAVDRKLRVIFANPAAISLISSDNHLTSITGQGLLDFVDKSLLPQNARTLLHDLRMVRSHIYEINTNDHDYLCHVAQLEKPNHGWVAVLNDVTKLKQVDRLKSQMVRMTSHDLKNPLFAIMTYMQLLEDDGEKIFTDDIHGHVKAIWKQLDRMQRIISGILDLEKVQSGAPPMESCDLGLILRTIVREMEDLSVSKHIKLESSLAENLPPVMGDGEQLRQAIVNLIDNAIKFTPEHGSIWVRSELKDNTIVISVQDNGIGIPKHAQSQVFDRFFRVKRADSPTLDARGSGLGLSLVKAVIDHHKGRIWLRSEENKGTTFFITLPIAKEAERQLASL
jgi:signal transduction histidine kinase